MDHYKLRLKNVHKAFGSNRVLRGASLDVKKGESIVIIGGSGSGKSVLLKCILGLIMPDRGEISVDGQNITFMPVHKRDHLMNKFGMLFQGGALFDSLPVWHNVAFGLLQSGKYSKKEAYDIAIEKLRSVGLGERIAPLFPAELSGGMQKRVSLARAVATNPEIIFFDEPTTGLDPIMADVINELIVKATKELGATTLTITHDMASARKIADDIAMIYEGSIIWRGAADDIEHSGNEYVDQFINGRAEGPIQLAV
ncbi:MAG: ATP-binding cassette domain-containing protein [Pseudomonadota bacterium]|jgi:phospholipid/cholesterol/gamma-HCH transport system ATP-binding protein|nr:ATP-binding cassette domain-containing protein [Pseudomonadota bacterium]QKK05293.1 MAG: ATP-binding cassette domain-containing protein [Pseudomonadota bacterium]|tara:strand:- start:95 stop:859 length:765 start_codon:yes stop_codon:yes gene_type:complete